MWPILGNTQNDETCIGVSRITHARYHTVKNFGESPQFAKFFSINIPDEARGHAERTTREARYLNIA